MSAMRSQIVSLRDACSTIEVHAAISDFVRCIDKNLQLLDGFLACVRTLNELGEFELIKDIASIVASDESTGKETRCYALYWLGTAYRRTGLLQEAIDILYRARFEAEECHSQTCLSRALNALGVSFASLHMWAMAERSFDFSIKVAKDHGLSDFENAPRYNLAIALGKQGKVREALVATRAIDPSLTGETSAHLQTNRELHIAITTRLAGFPRASVRLVEGTTKNLRQTTQSTRHTALAHEFLGDCLHDLDKPKAAMDHYKQALKIGLETAPEGDIVCEAYRRIAEVSYAIGDFDAARSAIDESWRLCDQLHDDYERVGLLRVKAGLALEEDDIDLADRHYREAYELCTKHGFRFEHALTLEYQGLAHRDTHRTDTATELLDEAAAIYDELRLTRLALRIAKGTRALSRRRPVSFPKDERVRRAKRWESFGLFTRDLAFLDVLSRVERAASTDLPVLIIGESGVGKELIATAVHVLSRQTGQLIDINCPAIPDTMLESELFGSRRGAFTGAENRDGLVALANNGSLFLDEVGDLPEALQAKLLRFLETSTYRAVGGGELQRVNVRLISAANPKIKRNLADERFRRDLFHRIAGVTIEVPPLRQRPADIEFLSRHFIRVLHREGTGPMPAIERRAMRTLHKYEWPGNVRELKHVIESSLFERAGKKRITAEMLPAELKPRAENEDARAAEMDRIRREMAYHDGSVSSTARALGITRQTLYRRIDELGLDLHELRR